MYSIEIQNREIIYYRPNVKKFYLLEKDRDENITYEIRATIDDNDRLLGVYSKKEEAQNIMMEMISDNFWTNFFGVFMIIAVRVAGADDND